MKIDPVIYVNNSQLYYVGGELAHLKGITLDDVRQSEPVTPDNFDSVIKNIKNAECNVIRWCVYWSDIEKDSPESYDEAYLAQLREMIKKAESENLLVYFVPNEWYDKKDFWGATDTEDDDFLLEHYYGTMLHLARRIKDCTNVIGFAFPKSESSTLDATETKERYRKFYELFQKKHPQYFFIEEESHTEGSVIWSKETDPETKKVLKGLFLENNEVMVYAG